MIDCEGSYSVERRYFFPHPRSFVFERWVDCHRKGAFYQMIAYDPSEGGGYVCEIETPKGLCYISGEFKEVIPDRKLRFTFGWDGMKVLTQIEVRFEDCDGGTLVSFRQNNLFSRVVRDIQQASWDNYHKFLEYQLEIEGLRRNPQACLSIS